MKNKKILFGVAAIVVAIIVVATVVVYNLNKVTYTKEFSYFPQYKGMKVQKYQPAKNKEFGNAIFKVEDVKYKDFLNNYESILKKDGWNIVKAAKPMDLEAKKNGHIVRIHVLDSKGYLTVLIWSR